MLFGGTWRLNDKGRYVNLAILEEQDQKSQEELESAGRESGASSAASQGTVREQHLASFENIYKLKRSVELEKLWETKIQLPGRATDNNASLARFVMALGRAGVGKSTCCKYIALMHAQLWPNKFDFVFLIPWRTLTKDLGFHAGMSLSKVLFQYWAEPQGITATQWEALYPKITAQPDKVLLLLDGYDELTPQQLGITTSLEQAPIVKGLLEAPFYKLLTSRPYGVENLHPQARFEITGFTNDNIKTYIDYYFEDSSTAKDAFAFMKANPSIWGVSHIPVTLELLCGTWQENKQQLDDDFTLTRLYHTIVTSLLRRYLSNRQREGDKTLVEIGNIADLTVTRVWVLSEPMLRFLSELAQAGLAEGNLIIGPHLIERCRQGKPDTILRDALVSGLLKSTDSGKTASQKAVYFIHLTFQEFLTAYAIIGPLMSPDKNVKRAAAQALKTIQYPPRYQVVVWFCSGLWDLPTNLSPWLIHPHRYRFWKALLRPPRDISLVYDASLLVRCIEEAAQLRKTSQPPKEYEEAITFLKRLLKGFAEQCRALPQGLIQALSLCPHFMTDHGFAVQLAVYEANQQPKLFVKDSLGHACCSCILKTWSNLGTGLLHCQDRLMKVVVNATKNSESNIREGSFMVLSKMFPHMNLNQKTQVCKSIFEAAENSERGSRRDAAGTLGNIFQHMNSDQQAQVCKVCIEAAHDSKTSSREFAVESLGQIFPYLNVTQQTQALAILIQAMEDFEEMVHQYATYTLCHLSFCVNSDQKTQILPILIQATQSPNYHARGCAYRTLVEMFLSLSSKQQTEVWQTLIQYIRNFGTFMNKALEEIFSLLNHEQQAEALQALIQQAGSFNKWVVHSESSEKVFPYLNPTQKTEAGQIFLQAIQDSEQIYSASITLGNIFPHLSTPQQSEIYQSLVKIARNSEESTQEDAAKGLGNIFPHLNAPQQTQAYEALMQIARDSKILRQKWDTAIAMGKVFLYLNADQQTQALQALAQISVSLHASNRKNAIGALASLPSEQLIAHHAQFGLPSKVLKRVLAPAVWESQSPLIVDAGQIRLHRPQDLTPEQHQTTTGLIELFQGRIRALEGAFKDVAGF